MHALSHLRSSIFTAIMNSRIVFAALLSVLVLRKSINPEQWRAIVVIFCSATVLCLEDMKMDEEGGSVTWTEESFGMLIAVGTALVSAAGGVLVEKYLSNPSPSTSNTTTTSPLLSPGGASPLRDTGSDKRQQQAPTAQPTATSATTPPTLWEQQGVLALFSAAFADLYVLLFLPDAVKTRRVLDGWNVMTVVVMVMQALHGILVAMTIQKCGIVFRLILGTISICLCICVESVVFMEPVVFREVLSIIMVIVGSNMYSNATPPLSLPSPPLAALGEGSGGNSVGSSSSSSGCSAVAPLLGPQKEGEGALSPRERGGGWMTMVTRGNARRRYSPTPA
jgi:UDP-sugar transporter A1/2/3